jgi:hypothetical protein
LNNAGELDLCFPIGTGKTKTTKKEYPQAGLAPLLFIRKNKRMLRWFQSQYFYERQLLYEMQSEMGWNPLIMRCRHHSKRLLVSRLFAKKVMAELENSRGVVIKLGNANFDRDRFFISLGRYGSE